MCGGDCVVCVACSWCFLKHCTCNNGPVFVNSLFELSGIKKLLTCNHNYYASVVHAQRGIR